ncbi:MAG: TIGR00296 family protein [Methanomassiliicoccaceae archaeon]|nr:TIGR00296 family protein [Methanomassiliicoccaceae archaeon]
MMLPEHGVTAVRIARCVITQEVTKKRTAYMMHLPFSEPSGVFVTINTFPDGALRGCIGYPEPVMPFLEALESAARSACHDPRFPKLKESELESVVIEVTVLTPPEVITVSKQGLLSEIRIGRDGLMLEYKGRRSVFLPQVPVEWGWDVLEYLENLCLKAGVHKNAWKEKDCSISAFKGHIFKELSPSGDVQEVQEC